MGSFSLASSPLLHCCCFPRCLRGGAGDILEIAPPIFSSHMLNAVFLLFSLPLSSHHTWACYVASHSSLFNEVVLHFRLPPCKQSSLFSFSKWGRDSTVSLEVFLRVQEVTRVRYCKKCHIPCGKLQPFFIEVKRNCPDDTKAL